MRPYIQKFGPHASAVQPKCLSLKQDEELWLVNVLKRHSRRERSKCFSASFCCFYRVFSSVSTEAAGCWNGNSAHWNWMSQSLLGKMTSGEFVCSVLNTRMGLKGHIHVSTCCPQLTAASENTCKDPNVLQILKICYTCFTGTIIEHFLNFNKHLNRNCKKNLWMNH